MPGKHLLTAVSVPGEVNGRILLASGQSRTLPSATPVPPWPCKQNTPASCPSPIAGAALDRQKCFDYLITDIRLSLALHAGCPAEIIAVRRNFYSRHIRYIRMAGAYSPPLCRPSGLLQGSSWSIDDTKLLMCVWTNRQHRYVPRSLSVTFVDDSNTTAPSAAELSLALTETERFDAMSGQQIHPGKVAGWALGQHLWDQVSQTLLCGHPLRMCDQVKLVGGCINAPDPAHDKLNLPATADARVKRAQSRLPRLESLRG